MGDTPSVENILSHFLVLSGLESTKWHFPRVCVSCEIVAENVKRAKKNKMPPRLESRHCHMLYKYDEQSHVDKLNAEKCLCVWRNQRKGHF